MRDLFEQPRQRPEYAHETEEEREARLWREKIEKQTQQEADMLAKGEVDEDLIMQRIELYIFASNCDYYHLCEHALYHRPAWQRVIRKNTAHITALIASYTAYRQHRHNVVGEPGTDARRNVTYDFDTRPY